MMAAELERIFWAVSDPKNVAYGQHLKQAEVHALLTPPGNATRDRGSNLSVGALLSSNPLSPLNRRCPRIYGDLTNVSLPRPSP